MTDSKQKGARAESAVKDLLCKETGLNWQRTPASGALHALHGLKGDLYVPNAENVYAVEVKHYADDQLNSKIVTSPHPVLLTWWAQTVRQADQVERLPLLIYKYDRSKIYVCFTEPAPAAGTKFLNYSDDRYSFFITALESFLAREDVIWVR